MIINEKATFDAMDALADFLEKIWGDSPEEACQEDPCEEEEEQIPLISFQDLMTEVSLHVILNEFLPFTRESYPDDKVLFLAKSRDGKELKVMSWEGYELSEYEFTDDDKAAEDWMVLTRD